MLVHPWDAALDAAEWRGWIDDGHDFGQLVVNGVPGEPPAVVPTHFCADGTTLLVHLARPNPVWRALERDPRVVLSVVGDYAFVPGTWRAPAGTPPEDGVPTSYYSAVQFTCRAEIVDGAADKAELLRRQLAHFQPAGDHADVHPGRPPYGRMLPGIRGLRLHVSSVLAKFKYDDHKPLRHRESVADRLSARDQGLDAPAARRQRRRLDRVGTWDPEGR
ncbi:FMN-binding negative transcriptional regulator [Streptomyces sp. HU2014]|uniref:FMN-binding negative transcriptional regulator n=1 Tax=Streptomyces sp. HU2014 TaxID=2939414 RepID=UPI00200F8953|nr:FMN-binding negative transcriptional regulator [Streptomyces sp. HU2014]UQI46360.1 FMN-binding negative transcriptional regulator [Streptomyces sp. HU2014]